MVTEKVHSLSLPEVSVATHVTSVVPIGNSSPESNPSDKMISSKSQLSVAVTSA